MRASTLIGILFVAFAPAMCRADEPAASPAPTGEATTNGESVAEPSPLDKAIVSYFQADDDRTRRDAFKQLKALPDVSFDAVVASMQNAPLWDVQSSGLAHETLAMPGSSKRHPRDVKLAIRVPDDYDPKQAYGLILGIPDSEQDPDKFVTFLGAMIGDAKDTCIIACVSDLAGVWLGDAQATAADPVNLLLHLKRTYHLDSDRIHLIGYGAGGQAACSLALLHSDQFASVMVLAGACIPDIGAEAIDLLLENLRNLPVTVVYGAQDFEIVHTGDGEETTGGVAGWNRYVASRAKKLNIPLKTFELPAAKRDGIVPPANVLAEYLAARRPAAPTNVMHYFRYPEQGSAAWLKQTRYDGEPWDAQQIVISPGEDESAIEAVTGVLREKLAHIGGKVDGQAIRINTHLCARIDVKLYAGLVDLDKEIVIHMNDSQRYEGKVERSIDVLLEEAANTWDFKRPIAAAFRISREGRAIRH